MLLISSGIGVVIGLFASAYCYLMYSEFTALAALPLAFACFFPILWKTSLKAKYSMFYLIFTATTVLRYVIHPVLVAYFQEYSEVSIAATLTLSDMTSAAMMMCYELAVCTFIIYQIWRRARKRERANLRQMNQYATKKNQREFVLPKSTVIYKLLILGTIALTVLFPQALSYFSFVIVSFGMGATSEMSFMASVTVILLISSKIFAHIMFMMWCKKKSERRPRARKQYALLAALGSIVFGCFHYGVNRAMIIFSLLAALFIYRLFFDDFWRTILVVGSIVGFVMFTIVTERRNYFNYMVSYSGLERTLRSAKMTINAYLGGVTNVAVSIVTRRQFGEFATLEMLIMDLLSPIVGLNRLLPKIDARLSGSYFNQVYFSDTSIVSQIIPTLGHGILYVGYLLAPLFDAMVLGVYSLFEKLRAKTMRIEIVAIFLTISMRMAMMFGVNIIIINNEISMQVLFPLLIFWLNNKVVIKVNGRRRRV